MPVSLDPLIPFLIPSGLAVEGIVPLLTPMEGLEAVLAVRFGWVGASPFSTRSYARANGPWYGVDVLHLELAPLNSRDLIETARGLTELSPRRPSQANLRRALSTAYYAVFHSLAATIADALMGKGRGDAWHQTYRALEHGSARRACQNMQAMREFPSEIQGFARTFSYLQSERHQADYALDGRYSKPDVLAKIDRAEAAIAQLEGADLRQRRRFAAHVLFKRRS